MRLGSRGHLVSQATSLAVQNIPAVFPDDPNWQSGNVESLQSALPASSPFFRNLRLSTAITPVSIVSRHTYPFAPKHVVSRPKNLETDRASENATASAAILDPKRKKALQILTDLPGYLAITEPATLMVQRYHEELLLA